jgi:ATP-dependent exoDNAse (exonuclease V) beta subunit
VLRRPNDETAGPATVMPGQHAFEESGYSVVWWDPGALELGAKAPFGVRREDLIVKDVPRNVVADGRSQYDNWRLAREDARAMGAIPSLVVQTAREWAEAEAGPDATPDLTRTGLPVEPADIAVVNVSSTMSAEPDFDVDRPDVSRPGGASFGVLVHGLLAQAPFGATRDVLAGIAAIDARLLGVPDDIVEAALTLVERVLSHDLLRRAATAESRGVCRRETPVSYVLASGTLVEGVVDLAFEEGGAWIVVDYKTDRELAVAGEDRYRRQIALYASAIAQATGQQASGVLARV